MVVSRSSPIENAINVHKILGNAFGRPQAHVSINMLRTVCLSINKLRYNVFVEKSSATVCLSINTLRHNVFIENSHHSKLSKIENCKTQDCLASADLPEKNSLHSPVQNIYACFERILKFLPILEYSQNVDDFSEKVYL